jgi:hypothetical protein
MYVISKKSRPGETPREIEIGKITAAEKSPGDRERRPQDPLVAEG